MMYSSLVVLEGAIDAHAHFVPDAYRDALLAAGIDEPDGFPRIPEWSPVAAIEQMDSLGIAASVISISSPGVRLGDDPAAITLARTVNEVGAATVAAHPDRFGFLASLPLPNVGAALAELAYAFDELGADGVILMSNVDGRYPGDGEYEELFAELDRRAAVVALHPASPPGWERVSLGRPRPMVEFPFDTTRAVVDLVLSGRLGRHPGIRLVVPHVGSALPVLADRVAGFTRAVAPADDAPIDFVGQLAELYYDVAGDALPRALPALQRLVAPSQILYGSDHPFPPAAVTERTARELVETDALDGCRLAMMLRLNSLRLFPRLDRSAGLGSCR